MMIEADLDLLALRNAPLPRLIEALDRIATAPAELDASFGAPAMITALAELAVDESVRLVRRGDRTEVADGGTALASFLASPTGRDAGELAPGALDTLNGLLPVLTAASSPSSKGGDALLLRSWNGKAREALAAVASTEDGVLPRSELRRQLNVSESYLSHLLTDMEGASLLERIGAPGQRNVDVHLGAGGHAHVTTTHRRRPTILLAPPTVSQPTNESLRRRLEASLGSGGPGARLRQSVAA